MKKFRMLKITLVLFGSVTAVGYYILAPALRDIQFTAQEEERKAKEITNRYSSIRNLIRKHDAPNFIARGKPLRVLRDDGTDYYAEKNVTPTTGDYKRQLSRLDELERKQLGIQNESRKRRHDS